LIYEQ
jgi:hypothetical protein